MEIYIYYLRVTIYMTKVVPKAEEIIRLEYCGLFNPGIVEESRPKEVYEEGLRQAKQYRQHCLERLEETLEKFRGIDIYSARLILSRYIDCRDAGVKEEATELLRNYGRLPALPEPKKTLLAA